jgi:hypothetical protein
MSKSKKEQPEAPSPKDAAPSPAQDNLLEKAKLIASLADAWQSPALKAEMLKLDSGERVYEIFSEAMNKEMASIMTGKRETPDKELQDLSSQLLQMAKAMSSFNNMIVGFMQSPLVKVLDLMNVNLGQKGFQQQVQQVQHDPPPSSATRFPEDYPQPSSARGGNGIGSF